MAKRFDKIFHQLFHYGNDERNGPEILIAFQTKRFSFIKSNLKFQAVRTFICR